MTAFIVTVFYFLTGAGLCEKSFIRGADKSLALTGAGLCEKSFIRGADKSLARSGRKQATGANTYDTIPRHTPYKQQQYIVVVCTA